MTTDRPALSPSLSGAELRRWYWTLEELTTLARTMGVRRGGGKPALTERLAAALDGAQPPASPRRAPAGRQVTAPVSAATVIPPGQRCSEVLRAYFRHQIGPAFAFDGFMRAFIAQGAGRTLGEAVAHWHATREQAARPRPIAPQFELNTFLRQWRQAHPGGSRQAALAAWHDHRSRPVDERAAARSSDPGPGAPVTPARPSPRC